MQLLPENERSLETLGTWGGFWEPVQFEVLPLRGPPNAEPILSGVTHRKGLAREEFPSSEVSDWKEKWGIHVRVSQPGFQCKGGGWRTRRHLGEQDLHVGLPMMRGATLLIPLFGWWMKKANPPTRSYLIAEQPGGSYLVVAECTGGGARTVALAPRAITGRGAPNNRLGRSGVAYRGDHRGRTRGQPRGLDTRAIQFERSNGCASKPSLAPNLIPDTHSC